MKFLTLERDAKGCFHTKRQNVGQGGWNMFKYKGTCLKHERRARGCAQGYETPDFFF